MKKCPKCEETKEASEFRRSSTRADGLSCYCKLCSRELDRERYLNPEKRQQTLDHMQRRYKETREHKLEQAKRYRQELRLAALQAYGGAKPSCACCGEHHQEFLEIDHVNNDGAAHRKEVGSSIQVLRWLRTNKYPSGFQVLCRNCNLAKWVYGTCPHEQERRKENGSV